MFCWWWENSNKLGKEWTPNQSVLAQRLNCQQGFESDFCSSSDGRLTSVTLFVTHSFIHSLRLGQKELAGSLVAYGEQKKTVMNNVKLGEEATFSGKWNSMNGSQWRTITQTHIVVPNWWHLIVRNRFTTPTQDHGEWRSIGGNRVSWMYLLFLCHFGGSQETHLNGPFWIPTYGQINYPVDESQPSANGKNTSWTPGGPHLPWLSIYHEWAFWFHSENPESDQWVVMPRRKLCV